MSEIQWGLVGLGGAGQEGGSIRTGHGLSVSGHLSTFPMSSTWHHQDFVFSNSQGKQRLGRESRRSWGESPAFTLACHISTTRSFHVTTLSQVSDDCSSHLQLLALALVIQGLLSGLHSWLWRTDVLLYLTKPWVPG